MVQVVITLEVSMVTSTIQWPIQHMVAMPSTTTVSTIKTYVLETVAYDLKASKEKQLVVVVTTQIEDPQR